MINKLHGTDQRGNLDRPGLQGKDLEDLSAGTNKLDLFHVLFREALGWIRMHDITVATLK